jgi:hypothetical protein
LGSKMAEARIVIQVAEREERDGMFVASFHGWQLCTSRQPLLTSRQPLLTAARDTRALQAYLGHKNIQHTVRYTELAPDRFKNFWR